MLSVFVVIVPLRDEGIYAFRDKDDAYAFADVVEDSGVSVVEVPVLISSEARDLITSEQEG